ncbi:MAG: folate family ECF transporter S component, partial [Firmicutes bacterium]|nr:folate family ECF transporter S component [Bacillota bacterium]
DVLGALLFPTGAYYPPLTLTSLLVGLTYGFFLHKISFKVKSVSDWIRIIACVVVRQGIWALLLQSYWLSLLYGTTYKQCLVTRIPQVLILAAVEIIFIPILIKIADMLKKAMNLK